MSEQPMTPQETHDAWIAWLDTGDRTGFERMLAQLRDGILIMETTEDGQVIRAASCGGEQPPDKV